MRLIIRFLPGESVMIAGTKFTIEYSSPSLTREGEPSIPITDEGARVLPGVMVYLATRQKPGSLALAFEAPPDVVIVRQVCGDVL